MARTGLTPRQLAPDEYTKLLAYGIGLTDLAKHASGSDAEVSWGFDTVGFEAKIAEAAPRALAFNGKRAAEAVLGRPVSYGRHAQTVGGVPAFVLPSTSGAARAFWDESYWHELAEQIRRAG